MRGGPDRRRSPPPQRRDDRRFLGPPQRFNDRRRQRSLSPPPDRLRRTPPFPKRFRRDDDGPPFDRFNGRYPEDFDRRGPPPPHFRGNNRGGYDEPMHRGRVPSPPPRRPERPEPYRQFMLRLSDDITPEESQNEYQLYLADFFGSAIAAEFDQKKNKPDFQKKFDPRELQKALLRRNEVALLLSKDFQAELESKALDPSAPNFNQGLPTALPEVDETKEEPAAIGADAEMKEAAPAEEAAAPEAVPVVAGDEKENAEKKALVETKPVPAAAKVKPAAKVGDAEEPPRAPEAAWKASRVASDLALSKELVAKLDAEKGIEGNVLLAEDAAEGEGATGAEATGAVSKYNAQLGKLDLLLTYLWRVHAVDYYGGHELYGPNSESAWRNGARLLRGARPESGALVNAAQEAKELQMLENRVDAMWKHRLENGDPLEKSVHREEVERQIDAFVESCVRKIDDTKWGNTLSSKMFVGKEYVLKHIRSKHSAVVDEEREKILDKLYYENFKTVAEEQQERQREAEALHHHNGFGRPPPPPVFFDEKESVPEPYMAAPYEPLEDGAPGYDAAHPLDRLPRGMGRGGRGPQVAGPRPPPGGPPMRPLMDGRMAMLPGGVMPGAMGGAMGGQVLMLAPGAGPNGPWIPVPMVGGGPMDMGMLGPGMGPGLGPMGPLRTMGPMGPMMMPPMMGRGYHDLDAPKNNRAVLDYGDI